MTGGSATREQQLAELGRDLLEVAYLEGNFVLRSGKTSNYYFDKYLFETRPHILRRLGAFLADMIPPGVERLAGPELGAVPLAAAVSLASDLPFVIVKKRGKGYGTDKLVEGELKAGERVLLIEDVVTTGGAVLEAGEALREAGANVDEILVVLDREEGAEKSLAAAGYRLRALFKRSDLGI